MIPFYGGFNGQSFEIKQVYSNRAQLVVDLNSAWASAIGVGEYVAINYGKPGEDGYDTNLAADSGKNFNSTVWQKVYDEALDTSDGSLTNANGLGYKLLFWTAGNVPDIILDTVNVQDIYNPTTGEYNEPKIEEVTSESESPDIQHFEFAGVVSQRMQFEDVVVEDADYQPTLDEGYTDNTRNIVTVTLHLPQGQVFNTEVVVNKSIAGGDASAVVDKSDINVPQLQLTIPASQSFEPDQISTTVIAAAATPSVQESYANEDTYHERPRLNFSLPQAQVMREGNTDLTVLRPSQAPTAAVEYTDSVTKNEPYLTLGLPRSVKFYKGSDLVAAFDSTYNAAINYTDVTLSNVQPEDCVINSTLGFLYEVTQNASDSSKIDLTYKATLYAPLPTVSRGLINTFNGEGEINQPSVTRTVNPDGSAWDVEVLMPRVPNLELDYEFIGSGETGQATLTSRANSSIIDFLLRIPRGAKWFVGTAISTDGSTVTIDGADVGDLYLNNSDSGYSSASGTVYQWDGSKWNKQDGLGLLGKTGPALNTITETIDVTSTYASLADVGNYLTSQGWNPDPNELIPVLWPSDLNSAQSYWFFKPGDVSDPNRPWDSVLLTGNISAITASDYSTNSNLVYNTTYINNLLRGSFVEGDNKDRLGYNATAVDGLIAALTQRVADLENTLAQDIQEQQSWGRIADLIEE